MAPAIVFWFAKQALLFALSLAFWKFGIAMAASIPIPAIAKIRNAGIRNQIPPDASVLPHWGHVDASRGTDDLHDRHNTVFC